MIPRRTDLTRQRATRRQLLLGLAGAAAAAACRPAAAPEASKPAVAAAAPAPDQPAAPRSAPPPEFHGARLKAHIPPLLHAAPIKLAEDLGYFREEGLDVELEVGNATIATMMQLLTGGNVHFFWANVDATLQNAIQRGAPVVAIAGGDVTRAGYGYTGMAVSDRFWSEGVRTPRDVVGRTVGTELALAMGWNTTAGRRFYEFMRHHGVVDPASEVKVTEWPQTQQLLQAFQAGQIDVVWTGEPRLSILTKTTGAQIIGWEHEASSLVGSPGLLFTMNHNWVKQNPEATVRVLRAYLRAVKIYTEAQDSGWERHPEVKEIIAAYARMQPDQLDGVKGPWFPPDGRINVEKVTQAMVYFRDATRAIKEVLPPETYMDQSYLEEALRRLGQGS